MPTYLYQCNTCQADFSVVHSFKMQQSSCIHCSSSDIYKLVAPFAAKTETSPAALARRMEDQVAKDAIRFQKDEKFAANILGIGDSKSEERKRKVAEDNEKYIRTKQEQLQKEGKLHPQQIRRKPQG